MPAAFSKDLRKRIVSAYRSGVGSIAKVARLFCVSERSVAKYLKIDRKGDDLAPGKSTGRPPLLHEHNLSIIKEIVLSNPSGTLFDYCKGFKKRTGLVISKSCMWEACRTLNLKRKKG